MEIDAYFQGFRDGEEAEGGGARMRAVLEPHAVAEEPEHGYLALRHGDGGADVYLESSHMLVNHMVGDAVWDLLVEGARAAGWVVLVPGRPALLTDESQREHLPEGYPEDEVVLVRTGADVVEALRTE